MATARKKQDEKHLKILRELVSLPANKQCFDCHQRGPTYINMTIGSFVCTSCSGLLRGLTPPHRVKSISMASFSPEEIELVKSRGNEYCRRIWLGLFDANHPQDTKDEQQIKDFMISKYEKKRYYLEPQASVKNGPVSFSPPETRSHSRTSTPTPVATIQDTKPLATVPAPHSKPLTLGVQTSVTPADNMFTPDKSPSEFLADFGSADPFSSSLQFAPNATQPSFANFENNPIFNASTNHMFGNVMSRDNVPPRYNTNRWSMPTAATLSTLCNSVAFPSPARKASSSMGVGGYQQPLLSNPAASGQPPPEDRYAALKDLDSLMKTQQQQQQHHHQQQQQQQQQHQQQQQQQVPEPQVTEWTTVPAATGSWPVSSSSSVVSGSVFGSPSQSAFLSSGSSFAESGSAANPFTGNNVNPWVPVSSSNGIPSNSNPSVTYSANPFRTNRPAQANFGVSDGGFGWGTLGMNGLPNGQIVNGGLPPNAVGTFSTSQSMNFPAKTWQANAVGNPFVLGASPAPTGHSSNPFL